MWSLSNTLCGRLDGDQDFDIVSGNTAGYIEWFENLSGPKVAEPKWAHPKKIEVDGKPFRIMATETGSVQGPAEAKWGYTTLQVSDWDGDGLLDIVFNSIWGNVEWLRNVGTASQPTFEAPKKVQVDWKGQEPPKPRWAWWKPGPTDWVTQWRTTPVVFDFQKDGLMDLIMLDQEGYLVLLERYGKAMLSGFNRRNVDLSMVMATHCDSTLKKLAGVVVASFALPIGMVTDIGISC